MKQTIFFLVIINCIVVTQSHAMEDDIYTLKIVTQLTNKPYCAQYVTNNSIVVGHEKGCDILDIKDNRKIVNISSLPCYKLAVHPDQKKIAFAGHTTIGLYNVKTEKQEWLEQEEYHIISMYFNTHDNTILLCLHNNVTEREHYIKKRDYLGTLCGDSVKITDVASSAFCAEQHMLCVLEDNGHVLSVYNSSHLALKPKQICTSQIVQITQPTYDRCYVSSEGHIAINKGDGNVYVINRDAHTGNYKTTVAGCLHKIVKEAISRVFFYPKSSIILTISKVLREYKMQYWDAETRDVMCTMEFPFPDECIHDFSFSPDRKEVMFNFSKQCIMTCSVPFEVRYKDKTKERFPYMLFLLKKYIDRHQAILGQEIPEDIRLLLAHTLLETFER